jgi:hypothetical protein
VAIVRLNGDPGFNSGIWMWYLLIFSEKGKPPLGGLIREDTQRKFFAPKRLLTRDANKKYLSSVSPSERMNVKPFTFGIGAGAIVRIASRFKPGYQAIWRL